MIMKQSKEKFDFKAFGQAIKAARKAKGISRNQLADKLNIYRVHWKQRAAPKFADFVWACNPAWRIGRPVLFPGTGTGEVHTPPSARYHAWHYERNGLKNHVCYCKRHRGSQQWQDGGIKFPRFCLHKVIEASQDCGVFLLHFFGILEVSL